MLVLGFLVSSLPAILLALTVSPVTAINSSGPARPCVTHTIALNGWLETRNGERVPFSGKPQFVAVSTLHVAPGIWTFIQPS